MNKYKNILNKNIYSQMYSYNKKYRKYFNFIKFNNIHR